MLSLFIFGILYAFAAVAQPGPFQTYIISQAIERGWRRTLPAAFAPILSDGPIAVLMLLILSQLPGWAIFALQGAGGILLLYLAWEAFKAWRDFAPAQAPDKGGSGAANLLKATLVNLLNPNPYLGWSLVMGPNLVRGWRQAPANGLALLMGFYGTMIACTMAIIVAMNFGHGMMFGPESCYFHELFGPRVRYSGASFGFQISAAIGGGFAPIIATAMVGYFGGTTGVSIMMIVLALVTLSAALAAPETRGGSLT